MAFDANGDGKLARTEVPERMQGLFDRADANKDGVLTSDELTKLADAQQQSAAQGERRGEFGRGGPWSWSPRWAWRSWHANGPRYAGTRYRP